MLKTSSRTLEVLETLEVLQVKRKDPFRNDPVQLLSTLRNMVHYWLSPLALSASRRLIRAMPPQAGRLLSITFHRRKIHPKNPPKINWGRGSGGIKSTLRAPKDHVFLNRVQQTVSGNKPSHYPPDTIPWTLFRCSLKGVHRVQRSSLRG